MYDLITHSKWFYVRQEWVISHWNKAKFYYLFVEKKKTYFLCFTPIRNSIENFQLLLRIWKYTKYVLTSVSCKMFCVKVNEIQTERPCSKVGEIYCIDIEATNHGFPYANTFTIFSHVCVHRNTIRTIAWITKKIKPRFWVVSKNQTWILSFFYSIMFNQGLYFLILG